MSTVNSSDRYEPATGCSANSGLAVVHADVRESLKCVWGQCDARADRAEFDRALENPKRLPRPRKSAAKRQAADTADANGVVNTSWFVNQDWMGEM